MPPPNPSLRPWAPILGPVDRTSFFEEQARHRRSTWRLTALCLLAITAMGLVVSCIVSPLVVSQLSIVIGALGAILPILSDVLGVFLPSVSGVLKAPVPLLEHLLRTMHGYFDVIDPMMQALDGKPGVGSLQIATGLAAILLPGIAATGLVWLQLRALFLRAGVGGVLLSLGAREPRIDDLEEQQLVNVVAEMAIAAGLQPPRVMLLDSDAPNAAVVGSGPGDATVIVSRRLLDEFDRDQTLGALGHLIGSIGNGDLGIAFGIVSLFQTWGFLMSLLDLPFSARARSAVWRVVRFGLRPPGRAAAREAEATTMLLSQSLKAEGMDDLLAFVEMGQPTNFGEQVRVILKGARTFFLIPIILANVLGKFILMVSVLLLIGPLIAFVWRSRRYLADSTAVQLTRNPNGIAAALVELSEKGGLPVGSQWAAHLFVVGTEVAHARAQGAFMADLKRMREQRGGRVGVGDMLNSAGAVMSAQRRYQQATEPVDKGTFAEELSIVVNFHPPLDKRLKRLRAQGAMV